MKRGAKGAPDGLGRILKWVGAATAVISLILGARQLITIATDNAQRNRESAEFVQLAQQQAARGEFADSWKSRDQADARARKTTTDEVRLDIAFRWLQDARPGPNQPFSRITDAVVPTLDRALLDPGHPRLANSMRQQNEAPDARFAGAVHAAYVRRYGPNAPRTAREAIEVPAADQLATFVWLVGMPEISYRAEVRDYIVAMLKEATGDRPAALHALRTLVPKLGGGLDAGFRSDVTREIKRLEREPRRE